MYLLDSINQSTMHTHRKFRSSTTSDILHGWRKKTQAGENWKFLFRCIHSSRVEVFALQASLVNLNLSNSWWKTKHDNWLTLVENWLGNPFQITRFSKFRSHGFRRIFAPASVDLPTLQRRKHYIPAHTAGSRSPILPSRHGVQPERLHRPWNPNWVETALQLSIPLFAPLDGSS